MRSPPWLKLAVFVLLAAHMQSGPVLRQVFRLRPPPFSMTWQMYGGRGSDVCEVDWYEAKPDGLVPVDRLATLKLNDPSKIPSSIKVLHSADEVKSAAERLCKRLPGTDLRAKSRCGIRRGQWKPVFDLDTPLCQLAPIQKVRARQGSR